MRVNTRANSQCVRVHEDRSLRNQEPARLASAPCRTQQKAQGRLFLGIDTHALSVPAQTELREKLRARLSDRGFERVAGTDASRGRLILAHLGNGSSLAAVRQGKSIDTTMAFTPAAGAR